MGVRGCGGWEGLKWKRPRRGGGRRTRVERTTAIGQSNISWSRDLMIGDRQGHDNAIVLSLQILSSSHHLVAFHCKSTATFWLPGSCHNLWREQTPVSFFSLGTRYRKSHSTIATLVAGVCTALQLRMVEYHRWTGFIWVAILSDLKVDLKWFKKVV
jgi:hypothetical protein